MGFNKYINMDGTLLISPYDNVDIVVKELVSFLQNKTHVTQLNLGGLKIGDEGIKELAKLTHLVSLDLYDNNIGDEGAKALANGKFANLARLDLQNNNIGNEGAEALANGKLAKLARLDLQNNNIGNEGAGALANGKLAKLTTLTLGNNDISDKGAREFVKLKDLWLDLSGNNISDQCARELANSIKGFSFMAKYHSLQTEPKTGIRHYIGSGVVVGSFLGLSIAYFVGAAALTPVIFAIAVFTAAAVVGALIGYGIDKFCEKISEEKQKDPDMSTWAAAKSVLCGAFTTQHRNIQKSV
ncbi:MAG: hypothetical protein ACR5K9_10790 [Wolbachia sp.]